MEKGRGRVKGRDNNARSYMSFTYRSKRVDLNDECWEKRMEEIIKRKIRKLMRKKVLFDSNGAIIKPPFTKEKLEYPKLRKLKLPSIDPYDGTKYPIDHV